KVTRKPRHLVRLPYTPPPNLYPLLQMSEKKIETVDLNGEYIEHVDLLSSFELGWNSLNLIYEIEPAGEMPESIAIAHSLVICQGSFQASYLLNGKWQQENYSTGDLVLFPANEIFPKVRVDREVPLILLYLNPTTFINSVCETNNLDLIPNLKFRDPLIQQMGIALKAELETGGRDSRLYAESMATALSAHLSRRYTARSRSLHGVQSPELKNYTGGLSPSQLRCAIAYIQENLDQNLSLEEISQILHISPHYFAHLFKQSTGYPPHQYITKCRIEMAKKLLRQRTISIAQICQQVGFQSQSHFTRIFRLHTNTTPKVYRDFF
ncbi:MAG: helix-turn-helix domain-containing protein, partial [Xenococcaceae cyanobacterium]